MKKQQQQKNNKQSKKISGLLGVKSGLRSIKVKSFFVAPEGGIVMKGLLWEKKTVQWPFAWFKGEIVSI